MRLGNLEDIEIHMGIMAPPLYDEIAPCQLHCYPNIYGWSLTQ